MKNDYISKCLFDCCYYIFSCTIAFLSILIFLSLYLSISLSLSFSLSVPFFSIYYSLGSGGPRHPIVTLCSRPCGRGLVTGLLAIYVPMNFNKNSKMKKMKITLDLYLSFSLSVSICKKVRPPVLFSNQPQPRFVF